MSAKCTQIGHEPTASRPPAEGRPPVQASPPLSLVEVSDPWQRTHSGCDDPNQAWDGSAPRRGELTSTVFLKPQAEYSSPLVQYVNPIANRNSRGFQLADGGCDPPIGQVVTRVIVKPDDQNPGMMANGSHDLVMQVFEVLGIPSQYG